MTCLASSLPFVPNAAVSASSRSPTEISNRALMSFVPHVLNALATFTLRSFRRGSTMIVERSPWTKNDCSAGAWSYRDRMNFPSSSSWSSRYLFSGSCFQVQLRW